MMKKLLIFALVALNPLVIHAGGHKNSSYTIQTIEADRTISKDSIAAVDPEKFDYLISGMKVASEAGYVEGSNELIDVGLNAGNLVLIPSGAIITVHSVLPMPKIPGASMITITYQGRDLIMLGFADSFVSVPRTDHSEAARKTTWARWGYSIKY